MAKKGFTNPPAVDERDPWRDATDEVLGTWFGQGLGGDVGAAHDWVGAMHERGYTGSDLALRVWEASGPPGFVRAVVEADWSEEAFLGEFGASGLRELFNYASFSSVGLPDVVRLWRGRHVFAEDGQTAGMHGERMTWSMSYEDACRTAVSGAFADRKFNPKDGVYPCVLEVIVWKEHVLGTWSNLGVREAAIDPDARPSVRIADTGEFTAKLGVEWRPTTQQVEVWKAAANKTAVGD